jgi:hypothetical protein
VLVVFNAGMQPAQVTLDAGRLGHERYKMTFPAGGNVFAVEDRALRLTLEAQSALVLVGEQA